MRLKTWLGAAAASAFGRGSGLFGAATADPRRPRLPGRRR